MKILRTFTIHLLLFVLFASCFQSEQAYCFADNSMEGQGCEFSVMLAASTPLDSPEYNSYLNIMLFICLKRILKDEKCRKKSRFIPVPARD